MDICIYSIYIYSVDQNVQTSRYNCDIKHVNLVLFQKKTCQFCDLFTRLLHPVLIDAQTANPEKRSWHSDISIQRSPSCIGKKSPKTPSSFLTKAPSNKLFCPSKVAKPKHFKDGQKQSELKQSPGLRLGMRTNPIWWNDINESELCLFVFCSSCQVERYKKLDWQRW